jgi:hypothetical protein
MAQANQGHTGVADVVHDYDATAVDALVNAASYSDERPSQGQWYSEVPPTGALTWVLGELAFYYGACCLYHRSAPTQGRQRPYY